MRSVSRRFPGEAIALLSGSVASGAGMESFLCAALLQWCAPAYFWGDGSALRSVCGSLGAWAVCVCVCRGGLCGGRCKTVSESASCSRGLLGLQGRLGLGSVGRHGHMRLLNSLPRGTHGTGTARRGWRGLCKSRVLCENRSARPRDALPSVHAATWTPKRPPLARLKGAGRERAPTIITDSAL